MKTAKIVAPDLPDTPTIPPDVVFHASPLSSTTGSTPSRDAILAAAKDDPSILAAILALSSTSGRSPGTEPLHE